MVDTSIPDFSLGLHLRDSSRLSGIALRAARSTALRRFFALTARPTGVGQWFAFPRLLRFAVPLAASSSGVRSSRVCLTRLLPPLTFLKPSTVCTSGRLACSVSYKHHLWDSKNTNSSLPSLSWQLRPKTIPPGFTILRHFHQRKDNGKELPRDERGIGPLLREVVASKRLSPCHSPELLHAVLRGGGHVDSSETANP